MGRSMILWVLGGLLALIALYLAFWPVPIDPVSWTPHPAPSLAGDFAPNELLQQMRLTQTPGGFGPEDVAVDAEGAIYVGLQQGPILRYPADGSEPVEFANTGGRPLGLDFDVDGNLIVADAFKGLLSVDPEGAITVLCTSAGYHPFKFVDDVDVDSQNVAWFSDASDKWDEHEVMNEALESAPNGRLVKYDINSGVCEVVLSGLFFANGIAVSPDETYVLVNETMRYRVKKVFVRGPKAGQFEVFADNLPGFPDGVSQGQDGIFWLAFYAPRNAILDKTSQSPGLRSVVFRIPAALQPKPERHPFVVGFNEAGEVVYNLQDAQGKDFAMTTSAEQVGDTLYVGSLIEPNFGRIQVSTLPRVQP